MDTDQVRAAFASRMHELCDELGIARGHGRNAALGRLVGKTPNAARKWLLGLSYPEMAQAVALCERAGVNVLWLLQGTGPKKGEKVDRPTMMLAEGLQGLPADQRMVVLEFLRFQFDKADGWFTNEALARYLESIDTLRKRDSDTRSLRLKT